MVEVLFSWSHSNLSCLFSWLARMILNLMKISGASERLALLSVGAISCRNFVSYQNFKALGRRSFLNFEWNVLRAHFLFKDYSEYATYGGSFTLLKICFR